MKYMIKPLESLCINYLLETLNVENVLTIFQFCIDCATDRQLMVECKELIQNRTEAVLKTESFPKISNKCLMVLLRENSLNISEVHLFEVVCF